MNLIFQIKKNMRYELINKAFDPEIDQVEGFEKNKLKLSLKHHSTYLNRFKGMKLNMT